MWSNIKLFTTEVLETAKDLKAHIQEVTAAEELGEDKQEVRDKALREISDHQLQELVTENHRLKTDLLRAEETYRRDVEHLSVTINDLRSQLASQSQLLKAKEAEADWASQTYTAQVQDLIKAKNRVQTDLMDALEDAKELPRLRELVSNLTSDLEKWKQEAELLENRLQTEEIKTNALREELEKNQHEEHIDRGFFVQFLEMYTKNLTNFHIRQEMLQSLVTSLALSPSEQDRLGIEPKSSCPQLPVNLQPSIFDSFKQFLLDD